MIETLKAQIGELMKGQSAERQQQIAELRKKLVNAAQEANELRFLPKNQSFINGFDFTSGVSDKFFRNRL